MARMVYIGLGSNLGDRAANLRAALEAMETHPAIWTVRASGFYETPPLGNPDQPTYLNAAAQIKTTLSPTALLAALHAIEKKLGRVHDSGKHWQPRTIDLDLLLYGDAVIDTPELTVPHPEMHLRSFVLRGLCELDGQARHPILHRTADELLARLNGRDFARDNTRPQLISIAGLIGVGKTTLATRLAESLNAKLICEKYDENPYLAEVYHGYRDKALDSELFFLSSSATQLRRDRLTHGRYYVSDYIFDKAPIYASSWLVGDDVIRYRRQYEIVAEAVVKPTLAIYLTDSVQLCLDRIHRRNRPYEQGIEGAFLEGLSEKYESLFASWTTCPIVRLPAIACETTQQAEYLANEFRQYLAAGTTQ